VSEDDTEMDGKYVLELPSGLNWLRIGSNDELFIIIVIGLRI
jgi:hypothetical protein